MKNLTATICLTITLLLGSVGASWSADWNKGLTAFKSGDYATALREWTPLADKGNARAQNAMGSMYKQGLGVPKDDNTAVKWYRLSAENGEKRGQFSLGLMYASGKGVPLDYKTALKWWTLAAKQGHARAQFNLGVMYEDGDGVPQDDKTALKWFTLAAKQGDASAQQQVEKLQEKIERERGEILLQDFVYGNDIRKLEELRHSVKNLCKGNIKCSFDKVWAYMDISKDGRLSLAEIARLQRNVVKMAAVGQDKNAIKTEEIAAINLASIIFLPITASSVLHSFDYNNDGFLSKKEVLGDTEFSKLVGVDVDKLATGLNFQSLGEKLKNSMNLIPFLK